MIEAAWILLASPGFFWPIYGIHSLGLYIFGTRADEYPADAESERYLLGWATAGLVFTLAHFIAMTTRFATTY